ncbi:ABC transporter permease subunit [Fictibacillus iocasae]|uniref:ABC transporter permease subunit n=1 Tax=Fictibacillus iocasae TaxID=2715437 RepID=A0ABW2NP84_9BACL
MIRKTTISWITAVLGIILLGAVPFAFDNLTFRIDRYTSGLEQLVTSLLSPESLVYLTDAGERALFPEILDPFFYSITVFFTALLLAVLAAVILSLLISLLPDRLYRGVKFISFLFESVPDILIAVSFQLFVIWFFKQTNVLLFPIASSSHQQPYMIPILCLAVLPLILCLRILLFGIEKEYDEPYIQTAIGKGMTRLHVLSFHILPNTLAGLVRQLRTVVWFMLSNLLVIELLFNIYGITNFVYEYGNPAIFTVAMLLFYLPVFLFFLALDVLLKIWAQEEDDSPSLSFSFEKAKIVWNGITAVLIKCRRLFASLFSEPLFVVGFGFLALLTAASLYHQYAFDDRVPQTLVKYAKDGVTPLGKAPFEPSSDYWLGTDQFGHDLFYKIVSGAKYTLGLAFLISGLRLLFSFFGGLLFYMMRDRVKEWLKGLVASMQYMPVALLCFFVLFPIVTNEELSFWDKGIFQILILTAVALPTVSVLIGSEIEAIYRKEFITGAKVLGGSRFHLFRKHIFPHLTPKLSLLFIQQVIYVLILLAHLGLLRMFFGGTALMEYTFGSMDLIPFSLSNEWSGLIGSYYNQMLLRPYLILFPVLFFSLTVIAVNLMLEGIKKAGEKGAWQTTAAFKPRKNRLQKAVPLMIFILFIGAGSFVGAKFSTDLKPVSAKETADTKETKKDAPAAAEENKPVVMLNEGSIAGFNEGRLGLFQIGQTFAEENGVEMFGKPEKVEKNDGKTIYFFRQTGYAFVIGTDSDQKIEWLQTELDVTRDDILRQLSKADEQSSDRTMLTYFKQTYRVNFFLIGSEKWTVSVEKNTES